MSKLLTLTYILLISIFHSFSQGSVTEIFKNHENSARYKIVMKTQNFNGTEDIALDNFTIKFNDGETKIYYIRYGDMLISSLTIPYSMLDRFKEFEKQARSVECSENCPDSILIDDGTNNVVIPIDILNEELISNLMLELEQKE